MNFSHKGKQRLLVRNFSPLVTEPDNIIWLVSQKYLELKQVYLHIGTYC
ncbi:hypothetical protein AD47_5229 [Escherichia coli 6-319-05_S4_C3]|nr:hypothetical protein AD47_5229 [Escherichia coli 6-319-05_S4_C3]